MLLSLGPRHPQPAGPPGAPRPPPPSQRPPRPRRRTPLPHRGHLALHSRGIRRLPPTTSGGTGSRPRRPCAHFRGIPFSRCPRRSLCGPPAFWREVAWPGACGWAGRGGVGAWDPSAGFGARGRPPRAHASSPLRSALGWSRRKRLGAEENPEVAGKGAGRLPAPTGGERPRGRGCRRAQRTRPPTARCGRAPRLGPAPKRGLCWQDVDSRVRIKAFPGVRPPSPPVIAKQLIKGC